MNQTSLRISRLTCLLLLLAALALTAAPAGAASAFVSLHSFAAFSTDTYGTNSDGALPASSLVLGSDGNFYGTTGYGGSDAGGTVFKITPEGALTTLVNFNGTNGGNPNALIAGADGNFYGTTIGGGIGNDGTVFKLTPEGALTTIYDFAANGVHPNFPTSLVQGSDSNFYGTTYSTVFKLTSTGTLTTLVTFDGTNGYTPIHDLAQGSDGNFYGATSTDAEPGHGTIFMITPTGALTTLLTFGDARVDSLVAESDGNFYGTTYYGGAGDGSVFKVTPAGQLTTLAEFNTLNAGENPIGNLVLGSDGDFYGTTYYGGSGYDGTAFQLTPAGALTTLYSFPYKGGSNGEINIGGANPVGGLVQGSDGYFYGVTTYGGSGGTGTVFKVRAAPIITGVTPSIGPIGTTVTITGMNLTGTTIVGFQNAHATSFTVNSSGTQITTTVPAGAVTGPVAVITNGIEAKSSMNYTVDASTPKPTIIGFSPASGPAGTAVTITGTNLTNTAVVGFMGQHAISFTVNAAGTQITTTVPRGAQTGPVAVSTNGIEAKSSMSFTVNASPPAPTITGFSPASGPVGTAVTITGTNLTGTTIVGFMGQHATSFTVNTAGTQITTTVPSGAQTGPVAVLTNGTEAKSPTSFTITP